MEPVDVIVVGSGGAGLLAACVAAEMGCRTLLVSKGQVARSGATATITGDTCVDGHTAVHELGLKARVMDDRARVSAAAFVTDYEKLVGLVRRPNFTGRGTEAIAINLGDVDIHGLELESEWVLTENLSANLSLGYLEASWAEFLVDLNNDGVATDNSHLDVILAPRWSASGALRYLRDVARLANGRLEFRLDARYQSSYNAYGQSNDDIYYRLPATKWNGAISLLWGEGNSVALFGRNLTDEDALAFAYNALVPWGTFDPLRILGVEVQFTL